MANGNVAQDGKVDNRKHARRMCCNTSEQIDKIRAEMARRCCFGDYSQIVSDEYAQRLREEFIPQLLAQLDYSDLEAVRRLCEGMAAHPTQPWVFEFARSEFDAKMARATELYHQYHS